MGWFKDLFREVKGQENYQETINLGRRREVPNPPHNGSGFDPNGTGFRYKLTEGYELEPDGEVVKSEGIVEALFKWF